MGPSVPSRGHRLQLEGHPPPSGASLLSDKKKEPKPKLFGPDIFRWGGGLPCEGVGAEKFGMSLETKETKLFWRDNPGFCWDIPEVPEKFEKKSLCSIFVPYFSCLIVGRGSGAFNCEGSGVCLRPGPQLA